MCIFASVQSNWLLLLNEWMDWCKVDYGKKRKIAVNVFVKVWINWFSLYYISVSWTCSGDVFRQIWTSSDHIYLYFSIMEIRLRCFLSDLDIQWSRLFIFQYHGNTVEMFFVRYGHPVITFTLKDLIPVREIISTKLLHVLQQSLPFLNITNIRPQVSILNYLTLSVVQYSQRHSMINHCERRISRLSVNIILLLK